MTAASRRAPRPTSERPSVPDAFEPFPAALSTLADQHGAGVGEDDAWDRWVSSAGKAELEDRQAELDREPRRAERADAYLHRVAGLVRRRPRRSGDTPQRHRYNPAAP